MLTVAFLLMMLAVAVGIAALVGLLTHGLKLLSVWILERFTYEHS